MTGLPNRQHVNEVLAELLAERDGEFGTIAVLFLDLDRFKLVNDSLGHACGDDLLVQTGARLNAVVRHADVVARLGGDEFVVLCRDVGFAEADLVGRRIVATLAEAFDLGGASAYVSASVGVSFDTADSTPSSLLAEADMAMYQGKQDGRGCVRVFDTVLRGAAGERHELENGLRLAIEHGELTVVFQPLVDLRSNVITGFELLSRWMRSDGTAVPPNVFIPIAKDIGLEEAIGDVVLEAAGEAMANWATEEPLRLAVNVAGRRLMSGGFVDRIARSILDSRIDPTRLTLEMTETVMLDDPDTLVKRLRLLKDLGVRLSVDDFGSGHSSLANLRRYPIDEVKIDRVFVDEITSSPQDVTIVDAVIRLCHALGYYVVAEGIERAGQASVLTDLGCDGGQGYLFGVPSTPELAAQLVHTSDRR